jgi:hypothetical protein
LTNIYEAAIGTNYANSSTTGDGLPDGWALFYTSTPPLNASLASQVGANGLTYLQSFQRGLNPLRTLCGFVSSRDLTGFQRIRSSLFRCPIPFGQPRSGSVTHSIHRL